MLSFGYTGQAYPRVSDIPEPVGFATITTSAPTVPQIAEECLAKGIKAVQILTAGFKESGEAGRQLEEQLTRTSSHCSKQKIREGGK